MRAILCTKPQDDLSTTRLTDVDVKQPGSGEVLVRVEAVSLNPVDWKLCTGVAPWWHEPRIVGLDAAGVIETIGAGVTGWSAGERVVWHGNLGRDGVFAEFAVTPVHVMSRIPGTVSFTDAAAIPCAGYTAYQGLVRKARIQSGETIVVQGATGGAGGFAVQIAKATGLHVIALAKTEDAEWARRLGADAVLDYRSDSLSAEIRAANGGGGADIMFEVVNPGDARKSLDLLRYNGQLVTIDPLPLLEHTPAYTYAASIHEVALGGAYAAGHIATQCDFAAIGDEMLRLMANGTLDSMITETLQFEQIPSALHRLRQRQVKGKLVAVV